MLYKEITEKLIGLAILVHRSLGKGFQEVIYQKALAIQMPLAGLHFEKEKTMKFFYGINELDKTADFFCGKLYYAQFLRNDPGVS